MRTKHTAAVSVRLRFADDARLGPGKIALLEAVARSGSIAAAGRERLVNQLQQRVTVDIYGQCGNKECPRANGDECYKGPVIRLIWAF